MTGPPADASRGVLSVRQRLSAWLSAERWLSVVVVLVTAIGLSVALAVGGWFWGDATSSEADIARFLPVSDALGYHSCAMSLAAFGDLDVAAEGEWCSRRILYTTLLSTLMTILAFDSANVLLMQSVIAGAAAAVFVARVARYVGLAGAAVAAIVLAAYAWEFVFGLFLTEVAGFSLSLCGVVLLLSFADSRRPSALFFGCALLSTAMAARAGALFVLPAIALWAWGCATGRQGARRSWRWLVISLAGLAVGPLSQYFTVLALGLDPSNTGGNFATSLYGLSIGSRDWTDAYRDFEPLFRAGELAAFRHIYEVALANIFAEPSIFFAALTGAAVDYILSLFRFGFFESANAVLTVLMALGIIACVRQSPSPVACLLLLLAFAELVSAPLIFDSGGVRIFGSTMVVRAALAGAGVQLIVWRLARKREVIDWPSVPSRQGVYGRVAAGIGAAIVAAMILPVTPLLGRTHIEQIAGLGCPDGLIEVIAHARGKSQMLSFTARPSALESVRPFRIGRDRFAGCERMAGTSFGDGIANLDRPMTILRVVDLSEHRQGARVRMLAYRGELPASARLLSLCIDPARSVSFVDVPHQMIKLVRQHPGS